MIICSKCNTENADNAIFCNSCGSRIDGKITCPKCGKENSKASKFCSQCGIRIDGKKTCYNCGKENDLRSKFCSKCGALIDENATCKICGAKVTAGYCTKCGSKYGDTKIHTEADSTNKIINRTGKILDLVGISILMLGVLASLIFVWFTEFGITTETTKEFENIFYYFGECYEDLAYIFDNLNDGPLVFDGSYKFAAYLPYVLTTILIACSLTSLIVFAIISIVDFIKGLFHESEGSPASFALLAIFSYLFCIATIKIINNCNAISKDPNIISFFDFSGITFGFSEETKIGIIFVIITATLFVLIDIVSNILFNLKKPKMHVKTGLTVLTYVFTILAFIFVANSVCSFNYSDTYTTDIDLSFIHGAFILHELDFGEIMTDLAVIAMLTTLFGIATLILTAIVLCVDTPYDNYGLNLSTGATICALAFMILSIIYTALSSNYIVDLMELERSKFDISCALPIAAFVMTVLMTATCAVKKNLSAKKSAF